MSAEIRILGSGDQALLDDILPDVFDHTVDPDLLEEFLGDPRHHLAVAIDGGQVVGFVSGVHYVHPDKPAVMFVNEVGVATTHQCQGLGKALLRAMLGHAKRLGCREAWVLTDRSNGAAMRLYTSTGGKVAPGEQVMFSFALDRDDCSEV